METKFYVTYKLYGVWNHATFEGFFQYLNWQYALTELVCGDEELFKVYNIYQLDEDTLR